MNSFNNDTKSKKSKGKPNAFLKFMLQMKKNEEKSGNFMSMAEAQVMAGEKWAVRNVDTCKTD